MNFRSRKNPFLTSAIKNERDIKLSIYFTNIEATEKNVYSLKNFPASRFNKDFIKQKKINKDGNEEEELEYEFPYNISGDLLDNNKLILPINSKCFQSQENFQKTKLTMSNHYSSMYINNSSDRWFTPPVVIESIVRMIGKPIDLDPASEISGLKLV
jgi:hypothetical protein